MQVGHVVDEQLVHMSPVQHEAMQPGCLADRLAGWLVFEYSDD